MSTKNNEGTSITIDISATDHTSFFNAIQVTVTGTLKYDDLQGNPITIAVNVPVGKFEVGGSKIYKSGTTLQGVLLS